MEKADRQREFWLSGSVEQNLQNSLEKNYYSSWSAAKKVTAKR